MKDSDGALVLLGSARQGGNTHRAVEHFLSCMASRPTLIDLQQRRVEPFSYDQPAQDDFGWIVDQMLLHRQIVFATPVYWYAMSGLMKTFFDRLTDLLLEPENRRIGRALAGREIWLLATGTDERLPPGFEEPFARTADYFDMRWREAFYVQVDTKIAPSEQSYRAAGQLAVSLAG